MALCCLDVDALHDCHAYLLGKIIVCVRGLGRCTTYYVNVFRYGGDWLCFLGRLEWGEGLVGRQTTNHEVRLLKIMPVANTLGASESHILCLCSSFAMREGERSTHCEEAWTEIGVSVRYPLVVR